MKVKLTKRLWNKEPGTIVDVHEDSAAMAMIKRKKYGVIVNEKAIEKAPENKAVAPKKRKTVKKQQFIGSKDM